MRILPTALAFCVSFLAAFLLFTLQPAVSKTLLPLLGGTPSVWNACMLTFQLLLLAGYIYAHIVGKAGSVRRQALIHTAVFVLALTCWPLSAESFRGSNPTGSPLVWVISHVLGSVGLAFFFTSATAPLLQRWVASGTTVLASSPYRLYSASNAGSFLGLIGFVAIIEPRLSIPEQYNSWSILFLCFAAGLLCIGFNTPSRAAAAEPSQDSGVSRPSWKAKLCWLALAMIPSSLMLGVTTYITTDIASIPLLWVLPLGLYLLSFVAAFSHSMWGTRTARGLMPVCAIALLGYALGTHSYTYVYLLHLLAFTLACFALHGLLASRKPSAHHLTEFYVWLSLGGVLGGAFNNLLAPVIFTGIAEYPIMLAASIVACLWAGTGFPKAFTYPLARITIISTLIGIALLLWDINALAALPDVARAACIGLLLPMLLFGIARQKDMRQLLLFTALGLPVALFLNQSARGDATSRSLAIARNFYGTVSARFFPEMNMNIMMYNTTGHGGQLQDATQRQQVTMYFINALDSIHSLLPRDIPLTKAVIGLGTGTLKCASSGKDHVDFYEINPVVRDMAENPRLFSFLRDCPGTHRVIMGDGRLQIAEAPNASYDVIFLDAFSSDAIPSHLLTREAIALYRQKLRPNGLMVFQISNRHLQLAPLLALQAQSFGGKAYVQEFNKYSRNKIAAHSQWVIMRFDATQAERDAITSAGWEQATPLPNTSVWSDDFSNLLPYFK